MNVWIRKTRKKVPCACNCGGIILKGSFQVVCQHYMKLKGGRTWWFRRSFIPEHWIAQGIAEVEKIPVVETRGKKKMHITDADRDARTAILRKRGSVVQRIKNVMDNGGDVSTLIHLGELINKLKDEIEPLGGVPKSWK